MVLVALVAALASACGGPAATFDPAGPCDLDGRAAGAYPDLEARLPTELDGAAPTAVDSGRHCTEAALGSLSTHDLDEVRYAGATWDLGGSEGVTSVVFADPAGDLPAAWVAQFYELGARAGKKTDNLETSRPVIRANGEQAWRLDVLNDLSFQSTVTWQDGPIVRTVLVATPVGVGASMGAHDGLVLEAVEATLAAAAGPG